MRWERPVPAAVLFRMDTSASKYQEFAAECERLAKEAKGEHHRSILMEMANAWRQLAEAAARKRKV
jgi:hypothetical protein